MERRVGERIETMVELPCRVPATPCRAVMLDLSRDGCRLQMPHANFERGATALINLPGAEQFPGRVVWVTGNFVGVRFQRRMSDTLAAALGVGEAPPEPEAEPIVEEAPRALGEVVRHWIRRMVGAGD